MVSVARPGNRRPYALRRFGSRSGGRSDRHLRAWLWRRNLRARCAINGTVLRDRNSNLAVLFIPAANMADLLAVTKIDVSACGSDDRRASILRKQQPVECGFALLAVDRQISLDPDRRSIDVDALVHCHRTSSR